MMSHVPMPKKFGPRTMERIRRDLIPGRPYDCWEWQGSRDETGYGRIVVTIRPGVHKNTRVHRIAYYLANGKDPGPLIVRHKCDNPPCCNPAHLEIGTHKDNTRDREERGRSRRAIGERHPSARLTEAQVLEMREKYSDDPGGNAARAGREYGLSRQNARKVLDGTNWKHLLASSGNGEQAK